MEIAGLLVHEYTHVLLRRCLGDFNISTPRLTGGTAEDESGRLMECKLFNGVQPKWWYYRDEWREPFASQVLAWLSALKSNSPLPSIPTIRKEAMYVRKSPYFGVSYDPSELEALELI